MTRERQYLVKLQSIKNSVAEGKCASIFYLEGLLYWISLAKFYGDEKFVTLKCSLGACRHINLPCIAHGVCTSVCIGR